MEKLKNRYQKFKISPKFLGIGIVLLCVLFLTIGFSAFLQKLYINDISLRIDAQKDIRITSVKVNKEENNGKVSNTDYTPDKLLADITLPNDNSKVSFDVAITNFDNTEMGVLKIENIPDNLEVVFSNGTKDIVCNNKACLIAEKVCNSERCNLNATGTYKVTIQYKEGVKSDDTLYNLNLEFTFRSYHQVTYDNIIGTNLPNEVIDGGTLEATLDSSISKENLEILIGNNKTTDYTYENNVLKIINVVDDVIIRYKVSLDNPLYAFMKEKSSGSDVDINFYDTNIKSGVYMHEETKNDPYPVYYYRGVVDNHLLYAGHCWQIVRTTEKGGLKLIYDGSQSNGTCPGNNHDYLGSEPFNTKIDDEYASPSEVGYRFGYTSSIDKITESKINDLTVNPEDIFEQLGANTLYAKSAVWDGNKYNLSDTYVDNNTDAESIFKNTHDQGYYYTCLGNATSCSEVYYLYRYYYEQHTSSPSIHHIYALKLTKGMDKDEATSPGKIKVGTKFGNTVSWNADTGQYTLVNAISIDDLDELEDDIRGGPSHGTIGHHYTCLSTSDTCSDIYYIYFNDYGNSNDTSATGLYGIMLHDGKDIYGTLEILLSDSSNSTPSYVESYLEEWFNGEGSDFKTRGGESLAGHISELEDALWCNDRTIAGYHGWDENIDNHSSDNKYLHFNGYKRLVEDKLRPDLTCPDKNDVFTVSDTTNGNGKLNAPVALLTADEAVLAGAIYGKSTNTYLTGVKSQYFLTPFYLSDDNARLFYLDSSGKMDSTYPHSSSGIKPVVVLNNTVKITGGEGTANKPYLIGK